MIRLLSIAVATLACVSLVHGFSNTSPLYTKASSCLSMAPRFNGERWEPTSPEEGPDAGYPPFRTLILHGPKPFFNRVFTPNDYEQAVLKYMAGDKVDRNEAQGNMDAYLRNPSDWAFNRMRIDKGGPKPDYVTLDRKQLILTSVWASIVLALVSRVGIALTTGESFWSFLPGYH